MDYNFDEIIDRRGSGSVKWDLVQDALPMWIADMDFRVAPEIRDAVQKRLDHGIFGYQLLSDDYYDVIAGWFSRRHGWTGIKKEQVIATTGVIAAYSACLKAFTVPGDKVIVQTPCYNAFFPAIRNNKCEELHNPLIYRDGTYSIDWDDLELKAKDPRAKVFLLCNPQNPAGRVWTREELTRIGEICLRNGLVVVSDEIHCELTYPGHDYTPFATLPDEISFNCAVCCSPTKAFNIAGIQIANVIARDPEKVKKIDRAINDNECCDVNVFGVASLIAAYTKGEAWLDALRKYLRANAEFVYDFLRRELPGVTAPPLEGTYLMWLDLRSAKHPDEPLEGFSERFAKHLTENAGLLMSTGTIYGPSGEGFERLNIACPRKTLEEGLHRLKKGYQSY